MAALAQSKALVVDDSRVVRALLARELSALGFSVCQAANGREGIDVLQREPSVSLTLVDWNMPEMNGLEFIRAVRADRRHDRMPLMLVTTETETENVAAALEAGAAEYLMKPFTGGMIADKLRLLGIVK